MGSIIRAICKCGFKSDNIVVGGGLRNYQTVCAAPAICINCRKLLVKNYLKKQEECPDCGKEVTFYNDPSLQVHMKKPKKTQDVFSWHLSDGRGDFQLPDTQYLCPKCGKMTLKFVLIGKWD